MVSKNSFSRSREKLNETFYKITKCEDPVKALRTIRQQKIIAYGLADTLEKAVARRTKTKGGRYSFPMRQTQSHQVESMRWYQRHVERLDAKRDDLHMLIKAEKKDAIRKLCTTSV
jgi:homoserine acetyltransferase